MLVAERRIKSIPLRNPVVNWLHPLSRGLVSCFLPGISRGVDLAAELNLFVGGSSKPKFTVTKEGPGLSADASGTEIRATLPSGSPFRFTNQFSSYYRGQVIGTPPSFGVFFGSMYADPLVSPFFVIAVREQAGAYQLQYNDGGAYNNLAGGAVKTSGIVSLAMAATVGGSIRLYDDGAQTVSASLTSAPTADTTAFFSIGAESTTASRYANASCTIVATWNRELSAAEMKALDADPYAIITTAPLQHPAASAFVPPPPLTLMGQIWM